ncbi:hypothetical protein V3C99_004731 [Haemonchus contortus]
MAEQDIQVLWDGLADLHRSYHEYRETRPQRRRRQYVRREHVPFLGQRTRTFDEYFAVFDEHHFKHYTRLIPTEFELLHDRLSSLLQHPPTHASPITSRQRLFIYLRYVGHGYTFAALAEEVHCGVSTVQGIVCEVAGAIRSALHDEAFPPLTRQQLEDVAIKTLVRYDYPRAVGFMDGKHINIKKPAHSGGTYYNYKGNHSIILLALVDCDHRILAFDVGAPGRVGDAGVYMRSNIKRMVDNNDHLFPPTRNLGNVGPVQYHILVDCGFAQGYRFVRPYTHARADTPSKRRFNAKHSSARQVVESTFGMLSKRFGLLQNTIQMEATRAAEIVTSLLVLHNLIIGWRADDRDVEGMPVNRELEPLEEVRREVEGGAQDAVRARELIRTYFDTR